MGFFEKLFDSNERDIARLRKEVVAINNLEPRVQQLSESQMRERIDAIRSELHEQAGKLGYLVTEKEQVIINPKIEALMKQHLSSARRRACPGKAQFPRVAVAFDGGDQLLRQGIDDRRADAVQAASRLVAGSRICRPRAGR